MMFALAAVCLDQFCTLLALASRLLLYTLQLSSLVLYMMLAASFVAGPSVTYAGRLLHFKTSDTSAYSLCVILKYFWLYC